MASRHPRTGQTEYKRVLHVFKHNAAEIVAVSIADKKRGTIVEVVKATPEHPFFTTHGLVAAGQLGIGTELVTRAGPQNGPTLVVAKVEKVAVEAGGHPVYNIEVEDDHTYFVGGVAGGIWVHNDCQLTDFLRMRTAGQISNKTGIFAASKAELGFVESVQKTFPHLQVFRVEQNAGAGDFLLIDRSNAGSPVGWFVELKAGGSGGGYQLRNAASGARLFNLTDYRQLSGSPLGVLSQLTGRGGW